MLLLWLACRGRGGAEAPAPPPPPPVEVHPPAPPAGGFAQGRFNDSTAGFSVAVPEGFTAHIGRADQALRLELRGPGGVVLRCYAWPGPECAPPEVPGCPWTFVDSGPYGRLGGDQALRVATCTPEDPRGPVHQATLRADATRCWAFDTLIPPGELSHALDLLAPVLASVRFDSG